MSAEKTPRFNLQNIKDETQTVKIVDASSITAESLPQQLGSDLELLLQGKVDPRRLSQVDEIERLWLTWFLNIPKDVGGGYSAQFCLDYLNLSMSLGGKRASQLIEMMLASSGGAKEKQPEKQGLVQRVRNSIFGKKTEE